MEENKKNESIETPVTVEETEPAGNKNRLEEQLLYLRSDFENYRRNVAKERASWGVSAQSSLLLDLLPIVDNFERALKDLSSYRAADVAESARFQGIELIYRDLLAFLLRNQVRAMEETAVFDPARHEAIARIPAPDKTSGTVVEVVEKGYLFKDTVLRYAKVVVAQ